MKFLNLIILVIFILFSNQIIAQNLCKPSKKFQLILKKSQIDKNKYLSIISFPNTFEQFYVKEENERLHLKYNICEIKLDGDSLEIKGFIKPSKNTFIEDYYFLVGNKMDTTYTYKMNSSYTNFKTLTLETYDAFYLKSIEYKNIETIDIQEIPEKLYFDYKLNINNKSLFIISTSGHGTEIFDLKAIRENLKF